MILSNLVPVLLLAYLPPALSLTTTTTTTTSTTKNHHDPLPPPQNYGIILLPAWDPIDIAGPLAPLQILAHTRPLHLSLISPPTHPAGTPVSSAPQSPAMNPLNSTFWPSLLSTATYASAPSDLEVLVVPGGPSVRNPDTAPAAVDFIRERFPSLRYLLTVCTGAGLAARAGVLDGRRATTNKAAWDLVTGWGPGVRWVSPARWVVDDEGKVWTSSGGTAGIDLIYAFITEVYSRDEAEHLSLLEEHVIQEDNCVDPFGTVLNITTVEKC